MALMTFTILGPPVTKKNHARIARTRDGRPFILQSRPHEKWVRSAVQQLRAQGRNAAIFEAPVSLAATIYRSKRIGDLVNFLQAICDALEEAGIVENDRLIQSFDGSRLAHDKENPRVEIRIEPMND